MDFWIVRNKQSGEGYVVSQFDAGRADPEFVAQWYAENAPTDIVFVAELVCALGI